MNRGQSRWTGKNVLRALAALIFSAFAAYYVLLIGIASKKAKVIAEGTIYAVVFSLALALPTSFLGALPEFLGAGAWVISAVRTYQLRALWMPLPGRTPRQGQIAHPPPYSQLGSRRYQAPPSQQTYTMPPPRTPEPLPRSSVQSASIRGAATPTPPAPKSESQGLPDDLSASLAWVTSTAKRNRQRLPSDAYITILETSQELDALLDAERVRPSHDAEFEYELEALVNQYLPAVLKGYLAIPPSMTEQTQPNGKTPNAELVEQLELLAGQTGILYASRHSHTTAELTTTGNFLRERFGHRNRDAFDFGVE